MQIKRVFDLLVNESLDTPVNFMLNRDVYDAACVFIVVLLNKTKQDIEVMLEPYDPKLLHVKSRIPDIRALMEYIGKTKHLGMFKFYDAPRETFYRISSIEVNLNGSFVTMHLHSIVADAVVEKHRRCTVCAYSRAIEQVYPRL